VAGSPFESRTIVIGDGPAGLKLANVSSVILEQINKVGSAWHRQYDRLHLHTAKKNSELSFLLYPKDYPKYISRSQLIEYLESYASNYQLDVRFHQQIVSARYLNNHWDVQAQDNLYSCASA